MGICWKGVFLKEIILAAALACLSACGSSPGSPDTSQPPSLLMPSDGDTLIGADVDFQWDAITGATRYYHQIDTDPSMQSPGETITQNPSLTLTPGAEGTYWWRVRASVTGQSSYTPWSETWSFCISP